MARLREYTAEVIITVKAKVNVAGHDDDEAYEEAMQKAMDLQDSITSSGLNISSIDAPEVDLVDWDYAEEDELFDDSDFYREEAQRDYELSLTA